MHYMKKVIDVLNNLNIIFCFKISLDKGSFTKKNTIIVLNLKIQFLKLDL